MRYFILLFLLSGCVQPVSPGQMIMCTKACFPKMLLKACTHTVKGLGCLCSDNEELWISEDEEAWALDGK